MKKSKKYLISLVLGIVCFFIGFSLYLILPIKSNNDDGLIDYTNDTTDLLTMLRVSKDVDIVDENKSVIGKAKKDEVYEIISLDKEDGNTVYKIKYNDDSAYIIIGANKKDIIEVYNERTKTETITPSVATTNGKLELEAEKEYYCEDGYTLDGSSCVKSETKAANKEEKLGCDGEVDPITDQCLTNITYSYTSQASEYCTNNNLSDKETCCKNVGGTYSANSKDWCTVVARKSVSQYKIVNYSCDKGWTLNNDTCEKKTTKSAKYNYLCPTGYKLNKDICIKE